VTLDGRTACFDCGCDWQTERFRVERRIDGERMTVALCGDCKTRHGASWRSAYRAVDDSLRVERR
jgi:hypothetical protein